MSSIFAKLLFVGFVAVCRMLLGQERLYYNISKTAPLDFISPAGNLQKKEYKSQSSLMLEPVSVSFVCLILANLLSVGFVYVRRMLTGQGMSYFNIYKTVPLAIILPTVIKK